VSFRFAIIVAATFGGTSTFRGALRSRALRGGAFRCCAIRRGGVSGRLPIRLPILFLVFVLILARVVVFGVIARRVARTGHALPPRPRVGLPRLAVVLGADAPILLFLIR
jgi:hypothetical protein